MHESTFDYLKPTDEQIAAMTAVREAAKTYVAVLETMVPPGADRDYLVREIRSAAMWANVAITRERDGTPRL